MMEVIGSTAGDTSSQYEGPAVKEGEEDCLLMLHQVGGKTVGQSGHLKEIYIFVKPKSST